MSIAKIALASLVALITVSLPGAQTKKADAFDIARLSWLAGTWEQKDGGKTTQEHWLPLAGSTMMGLSHTFDDKTTHFYEFLRITVRDGNIAYIAQPAGTQPVPFLLVELDEKKAVFENSKHDHPQRIRYERTDAGMTATISLLDGSRAKSFPFRKLP